MLPPLEHGERIVGGHVRLHRERGGADHSRPLVIGIVAQDHVRQFTGPAPVTLVEQRHARRETSVQLPGPDRPPPVRNVRARRDRPFGISRSGPFVVEHRQPVANQPTHVTDVLGQAAHLRAHALEVRSTTSVEVRDLHEAQELGQMPMVPGTAQRRLGCPANLDHLTPSALIVQHPGVRLLGQSHQLLVAELLPQADGLFNATCPLLSITHRRLGQPVIAQQAASCRGRFGTRRPQPSLEDVRSPAGFASPHADDAPVFGYADRPVDVAEVFVDRQHLIPVLDRFVPTPEPAKRRRPVEQEIRVLPAIGSFIDR